MNSMLEQLWYFHQSTHPHETDQEQHVRMHTVLQKETDLRKTFTPEQNALFLAYNEALGTYHASAERTAFLHGVRCAVSFLTEAMRAE